jgi:Tol biopolymer transport system component
MSRARLVTASAGALLVALSIPWTPAFSSGSAGQSCVRQTQFGDTGPAWSPKGQEVAFSRSGRIAVWNLRSRKLRTIEGGSDPVWSPNGKRLLFTRDVTTPTPGIAEHCRGVDDLFRAPSTGLVAAIAVTNTRDVSERAPAWSANSGIAYEFNDAEGTHGIAVLDPVTGITRVLVSAGKSPIPEPQVATSPSWSPDGRKLAFAGIDWMGSGQGRAYRQIFKVNADGSQVEPIVEGEALDPAWAPDGARIAFTRGVERTASSVFVVNIDSTRQRLIAKGFEPAWSPDGRRLVFVRERAFGDSCRVDNLFVVSLRGKKPTATSLLPRRLRVTGRCFRSS